MTGPSTPDFAERPPWTRPGFIAAAAVVALVVVGGVVVALLPSDSDPDASPPPIAGSVPVVTTAPGSGAVLPTAVPTTAPDDVSWSLVGQLAVPVSRSAGPASVSDTATGYAHTPQGALIAAAQLTIRAGFAAGRRSWEPTVERQFVASPDRDRLLENLRAAGDAAPAAPGELSQIAGFQYQSYSPDTAVIGLVFRQNAGGASAYHIPTVTVRWVDGDWQVVAPPGGAWTSITRAATDLTGVVEWGAR